MSHQKVLFFFLLVAGGLLREATPLGGIFELRLRQFSNPSNRDAEGRCCVPSSEVNGVCREKCATKFRICVKNYQVTIDPSGGCFFGEVVTRGGMDIYQQSGGNGTDGGVVYHFPFQFRWPGTFSLIIEVFHTTNANNNDMITTNKIGSFPSNNGTYGNGTTPYKTSSSHSNTPHSDPLITRLMIQQYLDISPKWKPYTWKAPIFSSNSEVSLKYDYRVRCLPDYYGDSCDKTCRPRDDSFGHYTCSEYGERVCNPGWSGEYCEKATCSASCHATHGHCPLSPFTCQCHQGWEGPDCSQCTRYPGCKHGKCNNKPFQCECDEGWGGLFCNQDLNYCTNHKPCLNGGTCFNTGQGSYTCECKSGWSGGDCQWWRSDEQQQMKVDNNGTRPNDNNACNCLNGGTCLTGNSKCACPPGFMGSNCDKKSEEAVFSICSTFPCANGATCTPLSDLQFQCSCTFGFRGLDCSEKIPTDEILIMETQQLREELSAEHIVVVVLLSAATPVMVVVAVGVVLLLKKRKQIERRRSDELARIENAKNEEQQGDVLGDIISGGGHSGGQQQWGGVVAKNVNNKFNSEYCKDNNISGGSGVSGCGPGDNRVNYFSTKKECNLFRNSLNNSCSPGIHSNHSGVGNLSSPTGSTASSSSDNRFSSCSKLYCNNNNNFATEV